MKFSFTKNPESECFKKNSNLPPPPTKKKKKNAGGWEGRALWGVARVSLKFLFIYFILF